jgi:signal transduction histidine kinase
VVHHAAGLRERNQELDAFSHTVAHDLKSPLQVVLGYANLLNTDYRSEISDEVSGLLRYIETYTLKMNRMIESILLLSQLRGGEHTISPVQMAPVVHEALSRLERTIAQRGVEVRLEGDFPPVLGDPHWLEEVFANLIDNAVKYIGENNPAPSIIIRGESLDGTVRYEVVDNGIGIQPEDQARLFEMFTRFHDREARGSGLGLSIVRRIIAKLGGEVGVETEPGQGSTFWFRLPAAPGAE